MADLVELARGWYAWANLNEPETSTLEIELFIAKLEAFTPAETMGFQCWAKGCWHRYVRGDSASETLSAFVNDKTPLLPGAPRLETREERLKREKESR